jgi:hypothetical protein
MRVGMVGRPDVSPTIQRRAWWILMEEAQYKLRRIQDELEYHLLKTPAADVARLQGVWTDTSERWLSYRRGGQAGSE